MDMNFKKYKTVSFDIFDTLVSRRIYRPRDLFSLMQSTLATEKFLYQRTRLVLLIISQR